MRNARTYPYIGTFAQGGSLSAAFTFLFFVILILSFAASAPVQGAAQLNQFGITWTFDKDCQSGQFANGDYWVVGPVTIIGINPPSTDASGRTMNGSMVNPSPANSRQGYDSGMTGGNTYDAGLNKALNLSAARPLVLPAGSSLVSTVSITAGNSWPQIKTAAVLTVVASAPPTGSFRPPYSGSDKSVRYNKSQLNYSLLKSLKPVGFTPALATVERYFERPWLDHQVGWSASRQFPADNMPNYGDHISTQIGEGALMLHLNFTNMQKEKLLIRYVQLGIDLYGIVEAGGSWPPDGGNASGRKWPIMFAGLMLNDDKMKNIGLRSGDYLYSAGHGAGNPPSDYIHFGEDSQTFYVSKADTAITHFYPQTGTHYTNYTAADIGLPEWGIRHATNAALDGKNWDDAAYRTSNTANAWAGFVLAAHIMNQKAAWNHNALFDYQDRYMAVEKSLGHEGRWNRQWSKFAENMWDAYRADYGCVWTRNNPGDIYSNGANDCAYSSGNGSSNSYAPDYDGDTGDYTNGRIRLLPKAN
jgi:hypothetical protein